MAITVICKCYDALKSKIKRSTKTSRSSLCRVQRGTCQDHRRDPSRCTNASRSNTIPACARSNNALNFSSLDVCLYWVLSSRAQVLRNDQAPTVAPCRSCPNPPCLPTPTAATATCSYSGPAGMKTSGLPSRYARNPRSDSLLLSHVPRESKT